MTTVAELKKEAKELKVKGWWLLTKPELEACINVKKEELRIESPLSHQEKIVARIENLSVVNTVTHEQLVAATIEPEQIVAATVTQVAPQGKGETVEEYLARGGKITELPAPIFPAPKPTRESSAMKKNPVPEKKAPRRVSKPTLSEQGETKEKRKPVKKVKAEATRAPGSGSLVTLASLVEASGIEARVARRRLRNSDIEKPGAQWEWEAGHADIAKVKELLK